MKSIKILSLLLIAVTVSIQVTAQHQYLKTTKGKLVSYGKIDTLSTFDATPVIMDTLAIADNTSGLIELTVAGSSAVGDGITGKSIYRYKKTATIITLSALTAVSAIVTDTGLSGGTFVLAATTGNNVKLTVTGKAAVTVRWKSLIAPFHF